MGRPPTIAGQIMVLNLAKSRTAIRAMEHRIDAALKVASIDPLVWVSVIGELRLLLVEARDGLDGSMEVARANGELGQAVDPLVMARQCLDRIEEIGGI